MYTDYTSKDEVRFWSKVACSPDTDACWNWQGSRRKNGYGHLRRNGHLLKAHRYAWEITNGAISDELCVLHRCDNRLCCNPTHLFLGNNADNNADMKRKGRAAQGDNHWTRRRNSSASKGASID